jgi:RNA polymerase sigma factor (TIGR02999 family)
MSSGQRIGAGGEDPSGEVTRLLGRWRDGDEAVSAELFAIVYEDLRRLAAGFMRNERDGHTLPPTGLVHEAYLRMVRDASARGLAQNRLHFFSIAAQAMRRILVEHARHHAAEKRPSSRDALPLDEARAAEAAHAPLLEILAVDRALEDLRAIHERPARVVELRYFAGLEESEVADMLGVSRATVTRDWRLARLLLQRSLRDDHTLEDR